MLLIATLDLNFLKLTFGLAQFSLLNYVVKFLSIPTYLYVPFFTIIYHIFGFNLGYGTLSEPAPSC